MALGHANAVHGRHNPQGKPVVWSIAWRIFAAAAAVAGLCAGLPAAEQVRAASPTRAINALPAPPFGSQLYGNTGSQILLGTDFVGSCNVHATTVAVKAGGVQLPIGSALENVDGCGTGFLYLDVPGEGHFRAKVIVDDAAALSDTKTPLARVFVLGRGGYVLHTIDVPSGQGKSGSIDADVAGGQMLAVAFQNIAHSYVYDMHVTGSAHVRKTTPLAGNGAPAGAVPVPLTQVSYSCNARVESPNTNVSISRISVPATSTVWMYGCGVATVKIPAGSHGTFAVRYGAYDNTVFTAVPIIVDTRVLDAGGLLLRKSVGLAYQGGGLQPLWVNVTGGSTVTISIDNGSGDGYLASLDSASSPGQFRRHPNPDHHNFGSPSGGPVNVVPKAFAFSCNAGAPTSDITVHNVSVLRNTYIWGSDCGVASLIMTNASGAFHALVGMDDHAQPGNASSAKLTVLDQNARPLYATSVKTTYGGPPVPLNAPITGGSIVKLEFTGYPIIFNLQMTGHATLYDRVFLPSEPPAVIHGGVPLIPAAFRLTCNAGISKTDVLMIHAAALEQWTLDGQGCGSATLDLTKTHYPRHGFGLEFGLAAADQRNKIGHVTVAVLSATGQVIRSKVLTAREGYGPQLAIISLSGGSEVRLTWSDQAVKVFAMTLA